MMNEEHENVQPKTSDQVIEDGELLLHDRQMTRLIQHLQVCSQEYERENEHSLDRIWSRLTQRQEYPVFLWAQRKWPQAQPIPLSRKERKAMQSHPSLRAINRPPSSQPKQRHSRRGVVSISLLVAVALITIVSFTIFSNVLRPAVLTTGKGTITGALGQQQHVQQQKTISNGSLVCSVGIDNPLIGVVPREVPVDWSAQGEIAAASTSNVTMFSAKDCSTKISKPLPESYIEKWSPDGNKLVLPNLSSHALNVLDSNGNSIANIPFTALGTGLFGPVIWSSDSTKLIFVADHASKGPESIKSIDVPTGSNEKTLMTLPANSGVILLSPDGSKSFMSVKKKLLSIWDVNSGKKVSDIPSGGIFADAFSPDGSLLALDDGSQMQIYATATGKVVTSLGNNGSSARGIQLAWSPDGRYLAQSERAISIYDVKAGKAVATFGQIDEKHRIDALAWAPDSTGLVSSTSLIGQKDASQVSVNVWKLN